MAGKTRERRAAESTLDDPFDDAFDPGLAEALARGRTTSGDDDTPPHEPMRADDESDDLRFGRGIGDSSDDDPDDDDFARSRAAPDDASAALARAGVHARRSVAEAALAARALLDAGALAATGRPAHETGGFARMADGLDTLAASLGGESPANEALLGAVAEAIDAEIGRWEARASADPDARAVLRAWLGLRELLWEVGVRRRQTPASEGPQSRETGRVDDEHDASPAAKARARVVPARGRRIQRVPLEG